MQIKETGGKTAQGIADAAVKGKKKTSGKAVNQTGQWENQSFRDSLQKNMYAEEQRRPAGMAVAYKKQKISNASPETAGIQTKQRADTAKLQEVAPRRIPYEMCDFVELCVLEGYTLKAKWEQENTQAADGKRLYVEMKNEDGEIKACLYCGENLSGDSMDVMEQFAGRVFEQENGKIRGRKRYDSQRNWKYT